jgi:hypothetical protein
VFRGYEVCIVACFRLVVKHFRGRQWRDAFLFARTVITLAVRMRAC